MTAKTKASEPANTNQRAPVNMETALIDSLNSAKPYIVPAGVAVGVLFFAAVGLIYLDNQKQLETAKTFQTLHEILSTDLDRITERAELREKASERKDKLQKLIDDNPDSTVAVDAEFHIAQTEFRLGNFTKAATLFAAFRTNHENQEQLASMAVLAEADCLFAQNDFSSAKDKYSQFRNAENQGDNSSYLGYQAGLQVAICTLLLGDAEESKRHLNDLLASDAGDIIEQRAQSLLSNMKIIPIDELRAALLPTEDDPEAPSAVESSDTDPAPPAPAASEGSATSE